MRRGLVIALVFMALPATARAGTVSATGFGGVVFTAAAGEANAVTAARSGRGIRLQDAGSALTVSGNCVLADPHTATCTDVALPSLLVINAGDGNDGVAVNTRGIATTSVHLGDGNDVMGAVGTGPVYADGGPGDDQLVGGDGPDLLQGGPGADLLDGRGGLDVVYYEGPETSGVAVSLDNVADDGAPGENDDVRAEAIEGTNLHDVLVGDAGANLIIGHGGDDAVSCLGGDDFVVVDDVFGPAADCEHVSTTNPAPVVIAPVDGQALAVRAGKVAVRVRVALDSGRAARGQVVIQDGNGATIGQAAARLKPGRRTVKVPYSGGAGEVRVLGLGLPARGTTPVSLSRATGRVA